MPKNDPELFRAYVTEKLTTALHILATGSGDARQRVAAACFACHTLREQHFPPKHRKHWRWITREVTKFGPYADRSGTVLISSWDNTMQKRRNATASKIAERIWRLYWAITDNVPYD